MKLILEVGTIIWLTCGVGWLIIGFITGLPQALLVSGACFLAGALWGDIIKWIS